MDLSLVETGTTADKALRRLRAIGGPTGAGHASANDHAGADQVLCDLLRSLGYYDVVDAYECLDRRYGW